MHYFAQKTCNFSVGNEKQSLEANIHIMIRMKNIWILNISLLLKRCHLHGFLIKQLWLEISITSSVCSRLFSIAFIYALFYCRVQSSIVTVSSPFGSISATHLTGAYIQFRGVIKVSNSTSNWNGWRFQNQMFFYSHLIKYLHILFAQEFMLFKYHKFMSLTESIEERRSKRWNRNTKPTTSVLCVCVNKKEPSETSTGAGQYLWQKRKMCKKKVKEKKNIPTTYFKVPKNLISCPNSLDLAFRNL